MSANGDYTASQITNVPAGNIAATDVQTALNELDTEKVQANAAITGATKTKITYDAKGLVTSGADATTADIADSTNKRYVTDAQLTVIGNTSGTNTGDNATNTQYSGLAASKQDALVSGTNIKTVNSTSLLGSGDIAVATTAQGALADSALQPADIASGTITARADDINFSGGSDGDVLTVQPDGSLALEAPSGGSGANTALSNLASVAINTSLVSDTDNTDNIGSSLIKWATGFFTNLGATGTRITKGWFTDIESTNIPTVNGSTLASALNLSGTNT